VGTAIEWFGKLRTKEVLKMYRVHLEKVVEIVLDMSSAIGLFAKNDYDGSKELFEKVFKSERQADKIKEEIITDLSKGIFHPTDREAIMRLVLTTDDIASHAKAASRKLILMNPLDIPDKIKEKLVEMAKMDEKIMKSLIQAYELLMKDPKSAIQAAEKVERLEEEVDEYRVDFMFTILKWGEQTQSVSQWVTTKEIIDDLEMVADMCEDSADVIRSIVVSLLS
jgi:hypothetical protein